MIAQACPKKSSSKNSRSSDGKRDRTDKESKKRRREKKDKYPACIGDAKYYPKAVPKKSDKPNPHSKSTHYIYISMLRSHHKIHNLVM